MDFFNEIMKFGDIFESQETIDELKDISDEIKKYDVYDVLARISGLNLMPHNQNKSVLLDSLIAGIICEEENTYDTIGSFIKGMKGEQIARRALKLISFDKGVKILYNIALEDEDAQAEYDAIVITPYGVFVIEVKNWGASMSIDENGILRRDDQDIKYDLPGRMSVKEGLLREYLGELFPSQYQGIVLFSNENAKVQDDYKQMPICYGGGIVYSSRAFNEGKVILTDSQIELIAEKISNSHKEQRALCKVNCKEIIEDYAVLMAAIEDAADGNYATVEELKNTGHEPVGEEEIMEKTLNIPEFLMKEGAAKEKKISNAVFGTLGFLVAFGLGIATAKTITRK